MTRSPAVAVIAEELCIGCTLCIEACPVDAIVGAARLMHTVIARDCIGCRLCLPPCPVDCISMVETGAQPTRAERLLAAKRARQRFELRKTRLENERHAKRAADHGHDTADASARQQTVQRAVERARRRLAHRNGSSN